MVRVSKTIAERVSINPSTGPVTVRSLEKLNVRRQRLAGAESTGTGQPGASGRVGEASVPRHSVNSEKPISRTDCEYFATPAMREVKPKRYREPLLSDKNIRRSNG